MLLFKRFVIFFLGVFSSVSSFATCGQALVDLQKIIKAKAILYPMPISRLETSHYDVRYHPDLIDGVVISFGSGPDVYRPLVDFPWAKHFHLVDILTGWGQGPGHLVYELYQRLLHLHPDLQMSIVDPGFLQHTGVPTLQVINNYLAINPALLQTGNVLFTEGYWGRWYQRESEVLCPLVIRLTFTTYDGVRLTKFLYLHPLDFNDNDHLDILFSSTSIKYNHLVGILITGIGPPKMLSKLADKLATGGTIVFEHIGRSELSPIVAELVRRDANFNTTIIPVEENLPAYFTPRSTKIDNYFLERK